MKTVKVSSGKSGIICTLHLRLPIAVASWKNEFGDAMVAGILGDKAVNVLSAKRPPHVALANLREEGVAKFVKDWGPLLATKEYHVSKADARTPRLPLGTGYEAAVHELLKEHPDAPALFFQPERLVTHYRELLRKAWKGERAAIESMQQHVSLNTSAWGFNSGRVEIGVPDLWTAVCILFLNDLGKHKVGFCKRGTNCPAPYFQKPRTDQKFCGGACTDEARKEIKRNWWNKNRGKQ